MSKNIRKMMADAAPKPDHNRKDAFVRMYRKENMQKELGVFDLLRIQLAYIRMPVWLVSLVALVVAIFGIGSNRDTVFIVAAIMPFVSGIAVIDSMRSRMYGMTEMEGVTRISVRGIYFARLVCIGAVHIVLLTVLAAVVGNRNGFGFAMTGTIFTIPYLISSTASMILERTDIGRKNAFGCIAVSALTGVMMLAIKDEKVFFAQNHRWIWYLALAVFAVLECIEIKKTFRLEEYEWN